MIVTGKGSKITPSEHSAYSLQHHHNFNPPQRRSFDQPFIQVSPTPPQSANPSADLSGASLARLSAQRAFSGVEMDTTRAAWHSATTRPIVQPHPGSAPGLAPARIVPPPPPTPRSVYQPRQTGSLSVASYDIAPAEALPSAQSSQPLALAGPAFLSQVSRLPSHPPSSKLHGARFETPGSGASRHVSFGKAVEYISPPRTVATSAGRSRGVGLPHSAEIEAATDWTAPWRLHAGASPVSALPDGGAGSVDEFGYFQFDPVRALNGGDDGGGEELAWGGGADALAGLGLGDTPPLPVSEDTELVLPWQLDGAVASEQVGGNAWGVHDGAIGGEAAVDYPAPSLFGTDYVEHGQAVHGVEVMSMDEADPFGDQQSGAVRSGPVGLKESDAFAREMRGWWHRSKP